MNSSPHRSIIICMQLQHVRSQVTYARMNDAAQGGSWDSSCTMRNWLSPIQSDLLKRTHHSSIIGKLTNC